MDYIAKYKLYAEKPHDLQMSGGKKVKRRKIGGDIKDRDGGNMEIKYSENLSEPWFSLIALGLKTVEGRKNKGRFKEMQVGDIVEWKNNDFKPRSILTRIIGKQEYNTFEEYLEKEGLENCLPGIPSMEHGLSVYFKYFTKEEEAEFGVVAIKLERVH